MTWSDAAIAGAFIVGAVAGAIGTIRLFGHVLASVRRERKRDEPPSEQ